MVSVGLDYRFCELCLVYCLNIVLLLSYSVSWPPFLNKHLLLASMMINGRYLDNQVLTYITGF